mgnify:CR=1 FL=1
MEQKLYGGLIPLKPDPRDFQLGAAFDLPKLSELPESFELEPYSILNQGNSDQCTAFATAGASALQEGIGLVSEYNFAISKVLSGNLEAWGQDLRTAMKTHQHFGTIEEKDRPQGFSILEKPPEFLKDIKNWPDREILEIKALVHAKNSYVQVTGLYDSYDSIRAAIWKFRAEKRAVCVGLIWSWGTTPNLDGISDQGFGHALMATGWEGDRIVLVNSWGEGAGDKGKHYATREIINHYTKIYGSFMFIDLSPEEYLKRLKNFGQSWINRAYSKILEVLRAILVNMQVAPNMPLNPNPLDPAPPIIAPHTSKIIPWAKAVQIAEGYYPNSVSYICKNPGNLKFTSLTESFGATGKHIASDGGYFCIFPSYEVGFQALVSFLTLAAEDQLKDYHEARTLLLFTRKYANPPNDGYANSVAKALGVSVDEPIKNLI